MSRTLLATVDMGTRRKSHYLTAIGLFERCQGSSAKNSLTSLLMTIWTLDGQRMSVTHRQNCYRFRETSHLLEWSARSFPQLTLLATGLQNPPRAIFGRHWRQREGNKYTPAGPFSLGRDADIHRRAKVTERNADRGERSTHFVEDWSFPSRIFNR